MTSFRVIAANDWYLFPLFPFLMLMLKQNVADYGSFLWAIRYKACDVIINSIFSCEVKKWLPFHFLHVTLLITITNILKKRRDPFGLLFKIDRISSIYMYI